MYSIDMSFSCYSDRGSRSVCRSFSFLVRFIAKKGKGRERSLKRDNRGIVFIDDINQETAADFFCNDKRDFVHTTQVIILGEYENN